MKTVQEAFLTAFQTTAWFETSGNLYTEATGNFDKQGLSWGPRQTCIGQGSLQPLLRKMLAADPLTMDSILGPLMPVFQSLCVLGPTAPQLSAAVTSCNDSHGNLLPAWQQVFEKLGAQAFVQKVFQDDAQQSIPAVNALVKWIAGGQPVTVRMWCLAYDFVTQDGGFNTAFETAITVFLSALSGFQKDPRDRMRAICWLRAAWVYIRGQKAFAQDVLGRKLLLVEGSGHLRGADIDADAKFGISDDIVGPL